MNRKQKRLELVIGGIIWTAVWAVLWLMLMVRL